MQPQLLDNSVDAPLFLEFGDHFDNVHLVYSGEQRGPSSTSYKNVHLDLVPRRGIGNFGRYVCNAYKQVGRIHREHPIDVISTSDALGAGLVGAIAKSRLGISLLVQIQGEALQLPPDDYRPMRRWGTKKLAVAVAARADAIRCVSAQIRDQAVRAGLSAERLNIVYSRCDANLFDPASHVDKAKAIRAAAGIPVTGTVLSFVGRVESHKGVFELIQAIGSIPEPRPHLIMVGEVPDPQSIERALRDAGIAASTTLTGRVPFQEVPAYLAASNVFVLPSHHEGTPRVVLEAMAMELPVIVTPVGGIPEVIEHGRTGLLLHSTDVSEISAAVMQLAGGDIDATAMGKAARRYVLQHHSFTEQSRRLIDLHVAVATGATP